jgi:hypothetical protein
MRYRLICARRAVFHQLIMHTHWRIADFFARMECQHSTSTQCWIPGADDCLGYSHLGSGYYRGGIMRQYCLRLRHRHGSCVASIDEYGNHARYGKPFIPWDTLEDRMW